MIISQPHSGHIFVFIYIKYFYTYQKAKRWERWKAGLGPSSNTTAQWCADRHLRAKWLQESSDIHLSGLPNFYLWSIQADSRQEKPQRQESRACFGLRKWPMNLLQGFQGLWHGLHTGMRKGRCHEQFWCICHPWSPDPQQSAKNSLGLGQQSCGE